MDSSAFTNLPGEELSEQDLDAISGGGIGTQLVRIPGVGPLLIAPIIALTNALRGGRKIAKEVVRGNSRGRGGVARR